MTIQCAIYGRLSKDANGTGVAVDRQLQDCRELAARRGWEVVAEYRDDSTSAWRRDVKRPGWDGLLSDIENDKVQAVVVWHGDRLVRQPYDLERLIRLVEDKGLLVASLAGERDLGKADDRFVIRIEVAAQCRESDGTARRVKRVMQESAEQGRRHGIVPFGWRSQQEADAVRSIVHGLLGGDSLRTITNALNDKGVPSPGGKKWTGTIARQVAKRWSNAGKREHDGVVVADGKWEALVTEAEQEAVLRLLADPTRRTNSGTYRRHLLSGIAVCAVCGGRMRGVTLHRRERAYPVYRCMEKMCVSIGEEFLDNIVLDLVQARIDSVDIAPDDGGEESGIRAELEAIQARKKKAALDYTDGVMDASQLRLVNERLKELTNDAEARLRSIERKSWRWPTDIVLANITPEKRRTIISQMVERIEVRKPAKKGSKIPDPTRVLPPVWRDANTAVVSRAMALDAEAVYDPSYADNVLKRVAGLPQDRVLTRVERMELDRIHGQGTKSRRDVM